MGNFYTNYALRGVKPEAVAAALAGRSAYVTSARSGFVIVFDEESDDQNTEIIAELAGRLSKELDCALLAVLNHDDDIFWYQLYHHGELLDEYDSSPGYFDDAEEEDALREPAGGDATVLCDTLGARGAKKVERILRKSSFDEQGYTFAFERHADLAAALGIPAFSVGTGFGQISSGELPDDICQNDLLATKNLPPIAHSDRLELADSDIVAGYYKVSFRAHPKLTRSIPSGWMPQLWADLECPGQELSGQFKKATSSQQTQFKELGFTEQGFKRLTRILNPKARDTGGINYLNLDRSCFGQLIYNRSMVSNRDSEIETVTISFTAIFEREIFSCTNHADFLGPVPNHNVVRLQSNDVRQIHEQFVRGLKERTDSPRPFSDLQSLRTWFDANALDAFRFRVRRGLFVRMSAYEVAAAKRKLLPGKSL